MHIKHQAIRRVLQQYHIPGSGFLQVRQGFARCPPVTALTSVETLSDIGALILLYFGLLCDMHTIFLRHCSVRTVGVPCIAHTAIFFIFIGLSAIREYQHTFDDLVTLRWEFNTICQGTRLDAKHNGPVCITFYPHNLSRLVNVYTSHNVSIYCLLLCCRLLYRFTKVGNIPRKVHNNRKQKRRKQN